MTTRKHLKARVRSRMEKTGERYAAARAHIVAPGDAADAIRYFPGIHPETTVMRTLAHHAGIPLTEEAALAIGGGIGAGVFAFRYEKEDFSSLFLAGRHRWEDGRAFLEAAARRLCLEPTVVETGSKKTAESELATALERGPVAAWVDFTELGYRGNPTEHAGGSYHVLVVHEIDGGEAIVGDLARDPIRVTLADLARARARVVKQRNRLLSVAPGKASRPDVHAAMRSGLAAGAEALATERRRNFSLGAFEDLARRLTATGSDGWARTFRRGRPLWTGLTALHLFVEGYFTGGGLMRPMFARSLVEAGLPDLAARYDRLGREWSDLANAALPDAVPALAEARRLQVGLGTAFAEGGTAATGELRAAWARLGELSDEVARDFPLSESDSAALVADLSARLRRIHEGEVEALGELRAETAG